VSNFIWDYTEENDENKKWYNVVEQNQALTNKKQELLTKV
jgi:hypothetical protein